MKKPLSKGAKKYYCQKNSCSKMCLIDKLYIKLGVMWLIKRYEEGHDYTTGWTLDKLYNVHSYELFHADREQLTTHFWSHCLIFWSEFWLRILVRICMPVRRNFDLLLFFQLNTYSQDSRRLQFQSCDVIAWRKCRFSKFRRIVVHSKGGRWSWFKIYLFIFQSIKIDSTACWVRNYWMSAAFTSHIVSRI